MFYSPPDAPTRVLHVKPGEWNVGGVENFVMSMFEHIDRSRLVFDVLTIGQTEARSPHDARIAELGGRRMSHIDRGRGPTLSKIGSIRRLYRLIRDERYQIVHIHTGSPFHGVYAYAARAAGARTVVLHSHTSGGRALPAPVWATAHRLLEAAPTHWAACSEQAARWLFSDRVHDKVHILRNGIDTDAFRYRPTTRDRVRAQLRLADRLVIGHVGRFSWEKNHALMVRILAQLQQDAGRAPEPLLLFVGDGDERPNIEALSNELGVSASVRFLGTRDDVADLMQAMDVFILPSDAEGFGIVGVEAQAAGLPCLFSTGVPEEVDVTGRCLFLPTDTAVTAWAAAIRDLASMERQDMAGDVRSAGYDVQRCATDLEAFYGDAFHAAVPMADSR